LARSEIQPPADGGKPENNLTGTIFQVDSWRSDAIQVPYPMSGLRFWRNTPNVSKAASGATTTLTQNILGYEWDASPDNGLAPAGLIDLSSTTLSVNTYLLDYGSTTGNGTPTHNLTLYRDPTSGALVFGGHCLLVVGVKRRARRVAHFDRSGHPASNGKPAR